MGEILVVGTSPVLLIEAMMLAAEGQDVAVLTGGGPFGGSWAVDAINDVRDIEMSCHLLEANEAGYEVLEAIPGLSLEIMDPVPRVRIGPVALAYGSRSASLSAASTALPALGRTFLRSGVRATKVNAATRREQLRDEAANRGCPIRYFVGGSGRMLRALRDTADAFGIRWIDDALVTARDAAGGGLVVTTEGGSCHVERLVVGEASRVDGLDEGLSFIWRDHHHTLYSVSPEQLRPVSYDRFLRPELVSRVSDITDYAVAAGDRRLLLVNHRRVASRSEVLAAITALGVIASPDGVDALATYSYRSRMVHPMPRHVHPSIDHLPTFGDLTRTLIQLRHRHPHWRRHLQSIASLSS